MLLGLVLLLMFALKTEAKKSVVRRLHGKSYVLLDTCVRTADVYWSSKVSYGIYTLSGSSLTYTYGCRNESCTHDCVSQVTVDVTSEDFLPITVSTPVFTGGGVRFIGKNSLKELADNDIGMISFQDKESCESLDLTKAFSISYNPDNLGYTEECFELPLVGYGKCSCQSNELICFTYSDDQCTVILDNITSNCDTEMNNKLVCGPVDLSPMNQNTFEWDSSQDLYIEEYQIVNKNRSTCIGVDITDDAIEEKICHDLECEKNCELVLSEKYTLGKNVDIPNPQLVLTAPYYSQTYVYNTKQPLELKKGQKNEEGYYDIVDTLSAPTFYEYDLSSNMFVMCDGFTRYDCDEDGKVQVNQYRRHGCQGDVLFKSHLEGMDCGALPHDNHDLD